nr:hypothetical protein [Leucobacter sp.]
MLRRASPAASLRGTPTDAPLPAKDAHHMTVHSAYRPAKADRVALVILMLLGAAIIVAIAVDFVASTARMLSPGPHHVSATFFELPATLPLGPGGTEVPASVTAASVEV